VEKKLLKLTVKPFTVKLAVRAVKNLKSSSKKERNTKKIEYTISVPSSKFYFKPFNIWR